MREFNTGATRNDDSDQLDYEGFLSPLALHRYAEYMHQHRKQADGEMRASDNWQKGIPVVEYMKSKWRHLITTWSLHRRLLTKDTSAEEDYTNEEAIEESLCAELFNTMGMLHEILEAKRKDATSAKSTENPHYCKKHNYSWNPVEQAGCWQCQNSQGQVSPPQTVR